MPSGSRRSSKRRSAVSLDAAPRAPSTNVAQLDRLALEQEGHRSVWASSSRSSTAGHARSTSAARGARRVPPRSLRDARWRGQHLELPADHGQRRAQLVGGVGDERPLARERLREAVEHVVEGVGEHPASRRGGARGGHPREQVAGVDARGDGGHPAQRRREPRPGDVGGQRAPARARACRRARTPRDAVAAARVRSRAARRRRSRTGTRPPMHDGLLVQRSLADVGRLQRAKPACGAWSARPRRFSRGLLGGVSPSSASAEPSSSGWLLTVPPPGHDHGKSSVAVAAKGCACT